MAISQNFTTLAPSLSLDFTKSKRLDSRLTFTRPHAGATCTYTGPDGLIRYAASNEPRFDHILDTSDNTVKCQGLLIEQASQNQFLQSVTPDNSVFPSNWSKGPNTTRIGTTTAPDGSNTAIIYQGAGTSGNDWVSQIRPLAANTTYTVSIWARLVSGTLPTGGGIISCDYNNGGAGAVRTTLGFATLTSEWKRFSLTYTNINALPSGVNQYFIVDRNTTAQIAIWGPQIEERPFMTTYIPTGASQVSRSGDNLSIEGTNFSSWFDVDEGTFIANFKNVKQQPTGGPYTRLVELRGATGANYFTIPILPNSLNAYPEAKNNDVHQFESFSSTSATNGEYKLGIGMKLNDFAWYNFGTQRGIDITISLPTFNRFFIGRDDIGGSQINGHVSQLSYFPRRLTNSQIQILSR